MPAFPADLAFRGDEQDLQEMAGNLLDNAKWAARRLCVTAARDGEGMLLIHIDDDGPGIPEDERERIFERGTRLDEQRPGSGLGLDIARDLARSYGGDVLAGESPLGGLRVTLRLPPPASADQRDRRVGQLQHLVGDRADQDAGNAPLPRLPMTMRWQPCSRA